MKFNKISIIGVGLIGSSFALALKKKGFQGRITGIGRNQDNLAKAKDREIIDDYTTSHADGVKDADLVLLATPVGQFRQIVTGIAHSLRNGSVLTDVGSVKAGVIKEIKQLVPDGVHFVGAHPIAGKECSGMDAATPDLFNNAKCIITPVPDTDREALMEVIQMWDDIGTKTVVMDPEEHDLIFAAVSHLPHVVSYALVNAIMDVDKNILHNGGRGLKDMTRIALSPAEIWKDICNYNRENILKTIEGFSAVLLNMKKMIESSDWDGLEKEFTKAKEARHLIESD